MANARAIVVSVDAVAGAMGAWPDMRVEGHGVIVPTHCLYGSNTIVRVMVLASDGWARIHDRAGAVDEFASSGGDLPNAVKLVRAFVKASGMSVSDMGEIAAPPVRIADLAPTLALVANASKDAAAMLIDRWKPRIKRDFQGDLRRLLEHEFPNRKVQPAKVEGHSTKQHRFDFGVPLDQGRLLIDAVAHESSAISASVLKSLDVSNAQLRGVVLRVVYDDRDEWNAEDINLLKLGATPIPFSRATQALSRLAA